MADPDKAVLDRLGIDAAKLAELRKQHGALHRIEYDSETVLARCPNQAEWRRFKAAVEKGPDGGGMPFYDAILMLVIGCVVAPDSARLTEMLDRRPGLAETFGNKLGEIAGLSRLATSEKL